MRKLDLKRIWRDHNRSFTRGEWLSFYIGPLAIGSVLAVVDVRINQTTIGIVATALSVFCALLFGLLIPIIDQARRLREKLNDLTRKHPVSDSRPSEVQEDMNNMENHSRLSEQLFANACFSILLALVAVVLCVILAFFDLPTDPDKIKLVPHSTIVIYRLFSMLTFWFSIMFVMTVTMLLRRMYVTFLVESQGTSTPA